MTLIATLAGQPIAIMASDRLVTTADRRTGRYIRDYDRLANKLIVIVARDAVVAIGYTGRAHLAGRPTDEWIVNTIAPNSGIFENYSVASFGFRRPSRLRFHQICNRLRTGLSHVLGGNSVTISICGWRIWRNLMPSISVRLQAAQPLRQSQYMKMRPRFPLHPIFSHVGATVTGPDLHRAMTAANWNPDAVNPVMALDMLTALIRDVASQNPSVGSNIMSVTIEHPSARRIICRFDPSNAHYGQQMHQGQMHRLPVTYNPWVLTPNGYVAPRETSVSGEGCETFEFDDWTIEMHASSGVAPASSRFGWSTPQRRI